MKPTYPSAASWSLYQSTLTRTAANCVSSIGGLVRYLQLHASLVLLTTGRIGLLLLAVPRQFGGLSPHYCETLYIRFAFATMACGCITRARSLQCSPCYNLRGLVLVRVRVISTPLANAP